MSRCLTGGKRRSSDPTPLDADYLEAIMAAFPALLLRALRRASRKEARPMQLAQHDAAKPSVGRPRKGHVYWHRDHWDIRIRLADGKRGKPQHLDPSVTEERARKLAAQASVLALRQGATPAPVPAFAA